jgi:predicted transcriptional regulator
MEKKLTNNDYFVLCVLDLRPRLKSGEPFTINELSLVCDLDLSTTTKIIKKLLNYQVVTLIDTKPNKYIYNSIDNIKWET